MDGDFRVKLDKYGRIMEIKKDLSITIPANRLWKREYYEGEFRATSIQELEQKAITAFRAGDITIEL